MNLTSTEAVFYVSFRLERLLLVTLSSQIAVKSHKNGATSDGIYPVAAFI